MSRKNLFGCVLALIVCVIVTGCNKDNQEAAHMDGMVIVPGDTSVITPDPTPDPELGSSKITLEQGPKDDYEYRQTAHYSSSDTKRVVKTVLRCEMPYISFEGRYVKYEWFRPDGTIERKKVIDPSNTHVSASVLTKVTEITYAQDGTTELTRRHHRPDGTLAYESDRASNFSMEYRADGKTLRSKQEIVNGDYVLTHYRLDGVTPLFIVDYGKDRGRVFFDSKGNPVNRHFESKRVDYSLGGDDPPVPAGSDIYYRPEGGVEYVQHFMARYDGDTFIENIGKLEISETEKFTSCVVEVEPRNATRERFIKTVEYELHDGTKLVRTYRAPNCREKEVVTRNGNLVDSKSFNSDDSFQEPLDERYFESCNRNTFGDYDTDKHDI